MVGSPPCFICSDICSGVGVGWLSIFFLSSAVNAWPPSEVVPVPESHPRMARLPNIKHRLIHTRHIARFSEKRQVILRPPSLRQLPLGDYRTLFEIAPPRLRGLRATANPMVGELHGRVHLDFRHVTTNAVAAPRLLRAVELLDAGTAMTFPTTVVEVVDIRWRRPMRVMTCDAIQSCWGTVRPQSRVLKLKALG